MLTKERKSEIALAALKGNARKQFALRDIANIKRNAGNTIKEPEMVAIHATAEEIIELSKSLLEDVFQEQMKAI